jgi:AraC-like DNA-binding protein
MKISYTSDSRYDIGEAVPIPSDLKKCRLDWGTAQLCMKYPTGYVYTQTFSSTRFDMTFLVYKMSQTGRFYVTQDGPALNLYFMLRGQLTSFLQGEEEWAIPAKGCGMRYQGSSTHIVELAEGTHHMLLLHLKPAYTAEIAESNPHFPMLGSLLETPPETDTSLLQTIINTDINQELMKLLNTPGDKGHQLYKLYGTVDHILSHCFHIVELAEESEEAILQRVAEKLHHAILEDPNNCHQLKHLASEHKVDARSLSRLYKHKYNERLKDTRKEGIMVKAMSLITETTMTIEDIAYLLGYSDRRALSRAIKKELGQTPESLRKLYGK